MVGKEERDVGKGRKSMLGSEKWWMIARQGEVGEYGEKGREKGRARRYDERRKDENRGLGEKERRRRRQEVKEMVTR